MSAATDVLTMPEPSHATPTTVADLHQALALRVQKERRHIAARRAYFAGLSDKGLTEEERVKRFREALFASDEVRRSRGDFDEVLHSVIREGL